MSRISAVCSLFLFSVISTAAHSSWIGVEVTASAPFLPSTAIVSNAGAPEFSNEMVDADFLEAGGITIVRLTSSSTTTVDPFSVTFSDLYWSGTPGSIVGLYTDTSAGFAEAEARFDPSGCGGNSICESIVLLDQAQAKSSLTDSAAAMSLSHTASSITIDFAGTSCNGDCWFGPLDIVVDVTHVPVPAAAWLFLSALGGLGWVKRKKA